MTEYKRSGICHCGATFEAYDRWQRSCDDCVAAKLAYEASRPPRICTKCGAQTQVFKAQLCEACHKEKKAQQEADRQAKLAKYEEQLKEAKRQRDLAAKPKEKSDSELRGWIDKRLSQQEEEYGGRYGYTPGTRKTQSIAPSEESNLEQVPHPDQDRIDVAFAELMGSVNWRSNE